MPGQWLLKKASRVFGWQKQVANWLSGATVVPSGDPPMDVEYEVRIWESGTMSAFIAVCGTLLKKPVISIGAEVDHPLPPATSRMRAVGPNVPLEEGSTVPDMGTPPKVATHRPLGGPNCAREPASTSRSSTQAPVYNIIKCPFTIV